jgi:hypothetical protein
VKCRHRKPLFDSVLCLLSIFTLSQNYYFRIATPRATFSGN